MIIGNCGGAILAHSAIDRLFIVYSGDGALCAVGGGTRVRDREAHDSRSPNRLAAIEASASIADFKFDGCQALPPRPRSAAYALALWPNG